MYSTLLGVYAKDFKHFIFFEYRLAEESRMYMPRKCALDEYALGTSFINSFDYKRKKTNFCESHNSFAFYIFLHYDYFCFFFHHSYYYCVFVHMCIKNRQKLNKIADSFAIFYRMTVCLYFKRRQILCTSAILACVTKTLFVHGLALKK